MKNTMVKIVAIAVMVLTFSFYWVNSQAYAQGTVLGQIKGTLETGERFSSIEERLEKLEVKVQALEKRNSEADAKADADAKAAKAKAEADAKAAADAKVAADARRERQTKCYRTESDARACQEIL